jgi:DNA repair protein RecO (recombination protein O)
MHKTKAIVIKTVKYGETSLIVTCLTELFGLQTYIVNSVRKAKNSKASYFLPGAILEAEVYHSPNKNIQRIKEYKLAHVYQNLFSQVVKNCVALFTVELIHHCVKQPEENPDLFYFCEDALMALDNLDAISTANFPLYFLVHFSYFFGFRLEDGATAQNNYLDLQEGQFVPEQPTHQYFVAPPQSQFIADILKAQLPQELAELQLNKTLRRQLVQQLEDFYRLHLPDFGTLKTIAVLQGVL